MLYPLPPTDFLTADNFVIAGACIGTILIARLLYLRLTRPALMSGTLSQR